MLLRDELRRLFRFARTVVLRTLAGLALFSVFLLTAFAAMRLAIHGREVTVPNLAGLSDKDAEAAADGLGLHLSVENRFYASTVGANHVLSQSPAAGSSVRRGWQLRVTESLGTQQVQVPDVTGQAQHAAELMLKRLQLEVGDAAHLPGPAPAGTILAQSPPPNTAGLEGPRIAVLVADDEAQPLSNGYVMPAIVGWTVGAANARLATVGLHITPQAQPLPAIGADLPTASGTLEDPAIPPTVVRPPSLLASSVILGQSPQPGRRVTRADSIHVTVAAAASTATLP